MAAQHKTLRLCSGHLLSGHVYWRRAFSSPSTLRKPATVRATSQSSQVFTDLLDACDCESQLVLRPLQGGHGLFTTRPAKKGEVLLRVPRSSCLVLDAGSGMSLPAGNWPRLKQGASMEEPLTYDILLALALLDALAGDGDELWGLYANQMLPQPEQLTLPMCWSEEELQQLQHSAIINAALQQQERLQEMLPGLSVPLSPGCPTTCLQWGFACVRSRSFRVGQETYALAPFADFANHAQHPNADFRALPAAGVGGDASTSQGDDALELVAVRDIGEGQEVTLSYSGPEGHTNQRFMAQYGFVPAGGNMADRLVLPVPDRLRDCTLRLEYLQEAIGDAAFMDAARGSNPYLFAALRSLPLADAAAPDAGASSSSTPADVEPPSAAERQLAGALLQTCDELAAECAATSMQEDAQLLERLAAGQGDGVEQGSIRLAAAVQYRLERKRLLATAQALLRTFLI